MKTQYVLSCCVLRVGGSFQRVFHQYVYYLTFSKQAVGQQTAIRRYLRHKHEQRSTFTDDINKESTTDCTTTVKETPPLVLQTYSRKEIQKKKGHSALRVHDHVYHLTILTGSDQ